jgi:hypothetical protein
MTNTPKQFPPYQSPLEHRPRYVRAIGMITVEITNLEIFLGDMLSVLLHIHPDIGRTVYLSPHSATARLDILENVRDRVLTKDGPPHRVVASLTKRTRGIVNRRNAMIHNSWGVRNNRVHRRALPWDQGDVGEQVKLKALNDLIKDIRTLTTDVIGVTSDLYQSWEELAKQRTSPGKHRKPPQVSDVPEHTQTPKGKARKPRL